MTNPLIYKRIIHITILLLSVYSYSQHGVIELKSGKSLEMKSPQLSVEGDSLRYYFEDYEEKVSIMGIGYRTLKEEKLSKSRLVCINDIKMIHVDGEISIYGKVQYTFKGIKYVKQGRWYTVYQVLENGSCQLLANTTMGINSSYSFFIQRNNDAVPLEIHRVGVAMGPKYKPKLKKYFSNCKPVLDYVDNYKQGSFSSMLIETINIYNSNCVETN